MTVLITTVGISFFQNYFNCGYSEKYPVNHIYEQIKNLSAQDYILESDAYIKEIIKWSDTEYFEKFLFKCKKVANDFKKSFKENINKWASAEIFSIIKFYDKYVKDKTNEKLIVYLIASDTATSLASANFIKKFFEYKNIKVNYPDIEIVQAEYIEGLKAYNINPEEDNEIKDSFIRLIDRIISIKREYKDDVYLNVTGGFKGFIPILTIIGQLQKIPLYYIYEESEHDIIIPQFPLGFDRTFIEVISYYLEDKKLLKSLPKDNSLLKRLLDAKILVINDKGNIEPSLMGEELLKYIQKSYEGRKDILGHYMEYKFEDLKRLIPEFEYLEKFEHSKEYYLNELNDKCQKERNNKIKRVEIDLYNRTRGILLEVKSFSGFAEAIKQIERGIKCLEQNDLPINTVGILCYKYDFQNYKKKTQDLKNLKSLANLYDKEPLVIFLDLPLTKSGYVNAKAIFEAKAENYQLDKNKGEIIEGVKVYYLKYNKN